MLLDQEVDPRGPWPSGFQHHHLEGSIFSEPLGVEPSASKLKKTTLAELKAMLDAKRPEEQRTRKAKRAVIDLDAGSPDADEARARVAKAASNVIPTTRRSKGVNLPAKPASQLRACRAGSRQAILIDHLARGATLAELVAAPSSTTPISSPNVTSCAPSMSRCCGLPTSCIDAECTAIRTAQRRPAHPQADRARRMLTNG